MDIYRSQAPTDDLNEYELITPDVALDQFSYTDGSLKGMQHGTRKWFYKIKIKEVADPDNFILSSYKYVNEEYPNLKWLKIYRQKKLSLKRGGRPIYLLKKRS